VIEECIEPDEDQDSEENFKPIFKQLRKIPGPENGIYDSGNPQCYHCASQLFACSEHAFPCQNVCAFAISVPLL
jgi:hypothetical protein